jgi:hypothetical protein
MDGYPLDTNAIRGGDGLVNTLDLIETLRRVTNIDTSRPVRMSRGQVCAGVSAPDRRTVPSAAVDGIIQVEGSAVYLLANRNLNLAGLALSLILPAGQQAEFTAGEIPPTIVDSAQPGAIAIAWLNGIQVPAGQRVLLGNISGAHGGVIGSISADEASRRAVRIVANSPAAPRR